MPTPRVRVPETVSKGEVVVIKTLIDHEMESGLRKDSETGKLVPRHIINKFVATFDGQPVFSADLDTGVAANPFLQFSLKVMRSGVLELAWHDDDGTVYRAVKKIEVSG